MQNMDKFQFHVLRKLYRHGCWGLQKMNEDIIPKGAPKDCKKLIMEAVRDLCREGFVCRVGGGLHGGRYFLNKNRMPEITKIVEDSQNKF